MILNASCHGKHEIHLPEDGQSQLILYYFVQLASVASPVMQKLLLISSKT